MSLTSWDLQRHAGHILAQRSIPATHNSVSPGFKGPAPLALRCLRSQGLSPVYGQDKAHTGFCSVVRASGTYELVKLPETQKA